MKELSLFLIYLIIGISTRTFLHVAPNIEFITAISFGSALFIENKFLKLAAPLLILVISDLIIGNSSIFVFTWSAFIFAPLFLTKVQSEHLGKILIDTEVRGILFTIFFFLWTNLGVVVLTEMYDKNLYGVFESYLQGLPFLANQVIGNIFIVPVIIGFSFLFSHQFSSHYGEQLS